MLSDQRSTQGVRPSGIFLAIAAVTGVAGWLTTAGIAQPRIALFVFILGAWTLSVIFHEFAHAFLAWRGGDTGVPGRGYLTLDPRYYTHPLLSFALPIVFIIWGGLGLPGGAVQLNRGVLSETRATMVALAGPFTNLTLGALSLLAIGQGLVDSASQPYLVRALGFFGFLQIAVFVLNMLPIPGFDGYAAIEPTLPQSTRELMRPVATYGAMLAVLFIFFVPPIGSAFFAGVTFIVEAFGVRNNDWACGYDLFRFWTGNVPAACT